MVGSKYIDRICIGAVILAGILAVLLLFGEQLGIPKASATPGYTSRLFDSSRVHTVDIQIDDWGAFVQQAPQEEYVPCRVEIDGEEFLQVGLRAKGNNSLRLDRGIRGFPVTACKLEFDASSKGGITMGWISSRWTLLSGQTAT